MVVERQPIVPIHFSIFFCVYFWQDRGRKDAEATRLSGVGYVGIGAAVVGKRSGSVRDCRLQDGIVLEGC